MRTEFVYSFMALGAIPVVVNAADVQAIQINADVLTSTDGSKVTYAAGKLLPGSYTFTAQLTSKVYGVEAKIGGKTQKFENGSAAAQNINIQFTLNAEADVELTLESTDPGESGAGFTVANPLLSLSFDFTAVKTALANNAQTLADAIAAYNYAAKQEDVDAAKALKTKANGVAETYADYKKYKFYATKSTIQEEIDALADKAAAAEAAYQNEQAYNRVNAAITAIKAKYNDAVAELKDKLVNEAAYLLEDALAELNTEINVKITEATQASYASYTGKTAVADEATNTALVPTEDALNNIVNDWKTQGADNQTAYNNLHAKVTGFQTRVNNVKPKSDGIAAAYPKTEAEAAITALNTKIENAKNSAAQLNLNVTTEETAAETKVKALEDNVAKANSEFDYNKATTEAIAVVQKAKDDAKTAVDAKVSKDGDYKAADYYAAYLKTQQDAIDKLTSDAAAAYKVNGTGTAKAFNEGLAAKTEPITTAISAYQTNAIAAVGKYDTLQTAISGYTTALAEARAQVENLAVYTDATYDYKTKFDLIQKRINDIKKAIAAAKEKVGEEHWTAMLAIDADEAITTDIAALLSSVQADQNQYDKDQFTADRNAIQESISAFVATEAVLGADYQLFADAEDSIQAKFTQIETDWAAIDVNAEDAHATIQALGERITSLKAEQTALEAAAKAVKAKVAANTSAKTNLANSINGLQTNIGTFKTTYKVGQDDSTLGLRGKSGGSVTTEVSDIETKLGTLKTANDAVVPTAVTNVEIEVAGNEYSNLANGVYDVQVEVTAAAEGGKVYANATEADGTATGSITLTGVFVTDGTLKVSVNKEGVKVEVKKVTFHENDQLGKYNNASTEAPGYNNQYTALNTRFQAQKTAAPGIKTAVENNAKANTAAQAALTELGTYELDNLKNLTDVSDADGNYSAKAKKSDPANWYVFSSDLDADKTYGAKKTAIDATITALTDAINAANAAETLPTPWNNEITVTTEDNPATADVNEASSTTYKISDIKAAVDALKAEAADESANYWAYRNTNKSNVQAVTDAITAEKTDLETSTGAGALDYYNGVLDGYEAEKQAIYDDMLASLKARTAVSKKNGWIADLKDLRENKVKMVKKQAAANLAKYTEQMTAAEETQTLWNSTYTEIAATDQSSKRDEWLDALDAIQVTLTAATNAVEDNYKVGKSVAEPKDFATIKAAINDVKARQSEAYNAQITADNNAAHESFMGNETTKGAIQLATEAYQRAVQERAQYSSTNEAIKAAVDGAAAALDEALFNCPTQLAALQKAENDAYVATVSPTVFDVSSYNAQALAIEQNITNELNTFKDNVQDALADYWTSKMTAYQAKVTAAENAIAAYSDAAKTDAFKDVKDLIAKGDAGVQSITLSEIEAAIEGLENIDEMLDADKDAAAVKDINAAIAAANTAYSDTKTYIEGKVIADDVNNVKETQLGNLEGAKTAMDNTLEANPEADRTFANHDAIKAVLVNVVTVADAAKAAVDQAIVNDEANTAAYEEIMAELDKVEKKLSEAELAAANYKYQTSFASLDDWLEDGKAQIETLKANGTAVVSKANALQQIADGSNEIETTLTAAFNTEKTGLATDITELKNQYNAYVAANGLNDKATAYKKDIDDLETRLSEIAIVDADDPADGFQYDEILAATQNLVQLQSDIADKESELLAANASTANADVLANFNEQLSAMEATASLEGYDEWVGQQAYGNTTLGDAITDLKAQLAELKTAINAEENISFYKDQYQKQIDAINEDLVPVTTAIAAKDAQFKANAAAYERLTAEINDMQAKIAAAKEKVGAYEYASTSYAYYIEGYYIDPVTGEEVLSYGAQFDLNQSAATIETANENKALNENSTVDNKSYIESNVQIYLDRSAYTELRAQRSNLYTLLTYAIPDAAPANKYSSALWARLQTEKTGISNEIDALAYPIWNSYQTAESTGMYVWVYDENGNQITKARTSDADYAEQIAEVNRIKGEITTLGEAVDNLGLLGDANEDGRVNVLDYQKVLNMILDPTLQPEEGSDLFTNIDINQSDVIEVGDLTAIVNYILHGDWQGYAAARSMNAEGESIAMNVSPMEQGKQRIAVSLANVSGYTAFQMDMVLPEGMTFVGASLSNRAGESHKLYSRTQLDGSIRVLASSVKGETFSGNEGAVLYIDVEGAGNVELVNILFSDVNAQTHLFTIGGDATGINNVSTFESLKQQVYDFGGRLVKGLKKGMNIIRRNDGSTDKVIVK